MSFKYRLIISLFFALLILIPASFYLKSLLSNTSKQSFPATAVSPTPLELNKSEFIDPNNLNIPGSFMGFTITSVERADSSIEENTFYFDFKGFSLPLKGWEARKEGLKSEDYTKYQKLFRDYLNSELTKRGWVTDLEVNGKVLQPLTADGPGGEIWGYVKRIGDKFQVIIIQERGASYKNEPIYSLRKDCPCNLSLSVFFSEVFNIDKFLKN